MAMDLNTQKERFSLSYIEAVASHAGLYVGETKVDRDSVDGVLFSDSGRRARVEFQAKSTARDMVISNHIHYPLSVKNYDDLRIEAINERILIVFLIPSKVQEWIEQTDEELCLRHCGYWMSLKGEPETANIDNITVHVPMANVFSSDQLVNMVATIESGGALC